MKNITLSTIVFLAMSTSIMAGGDMAPIEEPIVEMEVLETNSAFYVGLGYSYLTSNRTARLNKPIDPLHGSIVRDTDSNVNNVLLQVGYQFNQYFAIEGRYTVSAGDFSLTHNHLSGVEEDSDIDLSNVAIYLKPIYPIGDFSIYGLLGYGEIEREFNKEPYHTWDGSGFQWGAGLQYTFMDNFMIFADYTLLYDEENEPHDSIPRLIDTDFSIVSIGVSYKF